MNFPAFFRIFIFIQWRKVICFFVLFLGYACGALGLCAQESLLTMLGDSMPGIKSTLAMCIDSTLSPLNWFGFLVYFCLVGFFFFQQEDWFY